jgi:hypothetical protein
MFTLKSEETMVGAEDKTVSTQVNRKEKSTDVLQKLVNEEATLKDEKKDLAVLMKKLRSKVQKEIRNKKKSIQQLKGEIMNLKFSCEELTKSLEIATKAK